MRVLSAIGHTKQSGAIRSNPLDEGPLGHRTHRRRRVVAEIHGRIPIVLALQVGIGQPEEMHISLKVLLRRAHAPIEDSLHDRPLGLLITQARLPIKYLLLVLLLLLLPLLAGRFTRARSAWSAWAAARRRRRAQLCILSGNAFLMNEAIRGN